MGCGMNLEFRRVQPCKIGRSQVGCLLQREINSYGYGLEPNTGNSGGASGLAEAVGEATVDEVQHSHEALVQGGAQRVAVSLLQKRSVLRLQEGVEEVPNAVLELAVSSEYAKNLSTSSSPWPRSRRPWLMGHSAKNSAAGGTLLHEAVEGTSVGPLAQSACRSSSLPVLILSNKSRFVSSSVVSDRATIRSDRTPNFRC